MWCASREINLRDDRDKRDYRENGKFPVVPALSVVPVVPNSKHRKLPLLCTHLHNPAHTCTTLHTPAHPAQPCTTLHKLHNTAQVAQIAQVTRPCACVHLCICAFRPARYLDLLPISISINLTFDIKIFIKILDNGILLLYICSGIKAYHKPLTLPYITIYKYINSLKFTIMASNIITSPAKCIVKSLRLSNLINK